MKSRVKHGADMAHGSSCGQQGLVAMGSVSGCLLVNLGEETGGPF